MGFGEAMSSVRRRSCLSGFRANSHKVWVRDPAVVSLPATLIAMVNSNIRGELIIAYTNVAIFFFFEERTMRTCLDQDQDCNLHAPITHP